MKTIKKSISNNQGNSDSDVWAIPNTTIEQLRKFSAKAEQEGRFTAEQLDIIYEQKWFKLFVPKVYGGLGLSLPAGVRVEEELARIDGSLGWTVTLCSGANLFVGYIDQSIARPIFTDPKVCLGGSGQASGRAVVKKGGYEVTGKWRYATGAPHNTHFTANCVIEKSGKTMIGKDGKPMIKSFFFSAADVRIIDDWNTFGLKATASQAFEVERLLVDEKHSFIISPDQATLDNPIYHYPFVPFAETTLAVNTLGMTRHFIACCRTIMHKDDKNLEKVKLSELNVLQAKELFYEALDASWDELLKQGTLSEKTLQAISLLSRSLVKISREAVISLYPYCGIVAADASSTINRIWRDIFTASQHAIFR